MFKKCLAAGRRDQLFYPLRLYEKCLAASGEIDYLPASLGAYQSMPVVGQAAELFPIYT
jgi:hypothetical protein